MMFWHLCFSLYKLIYCLNVLCKTALSSDLPLRKLTHKLAHFKSVIFLLQTSTHLKWGITTRNYDVVVLFFLGNIKAWKAHHYRTPWQVENVFVTLKTRFTSMAKSFYLPDIPTSLCGSLVYQKVSKRISGLYRVWKQVELCTYLWVIDKHSFCGWNCHCLLNESQVWKVPFHDSHFPNSCFEEQTSHGQCQTKFSRGPKGVFYWQKIQMFVLKVLFCHSICTLRSFSLGWKEQQSMTIFFLAYFLVQIQVEDI